MRLPSLRLLFCCLLIPGSALGRVIHVPADQPTIAAGIAAAARGDVVELACGTYFEHALTMKSGTTVRSATSDPSCVTIDGQQLGRGFLVDHCDATTTIEGITFIHCNATPDNGRGGGIWIISSSPIIRGCIFTQCTSSGFYAGVIVVQNDMSSPSISECQFLSNPGGGLNIISSANVTVSRCLFVAGGIGAGNNTSVHVSRSSFVSAGTGISRTGVAVVSTSMFYGSSAQVDSAQCCVTNSAFTAGWSSGVIQTDPRLCTPTGPSYTVHSNSACLVTSGPCAGILGYTGAGCGPAAPISVTVTTSTPGVPIVVDGVPTTSPAVFSWYAMSEHRVSIDSTWAQTATSRWRFASWSDGGARSHYAILWPGTTTLTAQVRKQWKVKTAIMTDPGAGQGSVVSPADAWGDEGLPFQLTGVPGPGSVFGDWIGIGTGSYTGTANPAVLTLFNSVTERAHFVPLGYEFSVSASGTDPSVHQDAPTGGLRSLYLWLTCSRSGISAFEAHFLGSLQVLGFNPADGVLNAGSGDHLLIAVGNCPTGAGISKLLGTINVWDTGGTICLGAASGDPFGAADCASIPSFAADPGVTGFASSGTACRTGTRTCMGASDPTLTQPRIMSSMEGPGLTRFAASPNPFARECTLAFALARPSHARLEIFDVAGRRVARVLDADLPAGPQTVVWSGVGRDGGRAQDGVYFARLESGGETRLAKLVLLQPTH